MRFSDLGNSISYLVGRFREQPPPNVPANLRPFKLKATNKAAFNCTAPKNDWRNPVARVFAVFSKAGPKNLSDDPHIILYNANRDSIDSASTMTLFESNNEYSPESTGLISQFDDWDDQPVYKKSPLGHVHSWAESTLLNLSPKSNISNASTATLPEPTAPMSKPATPMSKPATSMSEPATPMSKPATPNTASTLPKIEPPSPKTATSSPKTATSSTKAATSSPETAPYLLKPALPPVKTINPVSNTATNMPETAIPWPQPLILTNTSKTPASATSTSAFKSATETSRVALSLSTQHNKVNAVSPKTTTPMPLQPLGGHEGNHEFIPISDFLRPYTGEIDPGYSTTINDICLYDEFDSCQPYTADETIGIAL